VTRLPEAAFPLWVWLGPLLLMAFGDDLMLAGRCSHLYQSNNRLAAHLAEIIRSQSLQKPENSS